MARIREGERWGPWRLEAKTLELVFEGRGSYRIDLATIVDAPNMVDWIFHMKEKEAWVTNDVMGHLLDAFRDLFDPLVHSTSYRSIDPRKYLQQLLVDRAM
jgi:hypothetical protein